MIKTISMKQKTWWFRSVVISNYFQEKGTWRKNGRGKKNKIFLSKCGECLHSKPQK